MSQQNHPTIFKNPFFDNKSLGLQPEKSLAKRDFDDHQILNNDLFSQAIQTQSLNLIHQESSFDFDEWKDIYDLIKQNDEFPSQNGSLSQQQLSRVESFVKELQQNPFYDTNGLQKNSSQSSELKKLLQQNNIYQNDLYSQSVKSLGRQGSSAVNDRFKDLYNVQNEGNWLSDMTLSKEMQLNSNFFPKHNEKLSTIESQVQALQTNDSFSDFISNIDQHNNESKKKELLRARQKTLQELRIKERQLEELNKKQNINKKDALTNILQGNPMSTQELINNKEGDGIQTYQILNYSVNKIRSLLSMDHEDKIKRIDSTNSIDSLEQDLKGKSNLYRSKDELSSFGGHSHSHSQPDSYQKNPSFRQLNFQEGYNSGNDSNRGPSKSQQMRFSQGIALIDDLINESSQQNNSSDTKSLKDSRSFRSLKSRSGAARKTGGSTISPRRLSHERSAIPNELKQYSGSTKRGQHIQNNYQDNQQGDIEVDIAAQSDLLDSQESKLVSRSKSKNLKTRDLSTQNTQQKLMSKDDLDGTFPDEIQQLKMSLQKNKTSSFSSKSSNQKFKLDSMYKKAPGLQVQNSDLEQIQSKKSSELSTLEREYIRSQKKRNNPFISPEKQGTSDDSREDLIFSINSANNKLRHSTSKRELHGADSKPSRKKEQLQNFDDNKITYVSKQNKLNQYLQNSRDPRIPMQQQQMELEMEIEPVSKSDQKQNPFVITKDTQNTNDNSLLSVDLPSYNKNSVDMMCSKNNSLGIKDSPQRYHSNSGIRSKPSSNDQEIEIDFQGKKIMGDTAGSYTGGSQVLSGSHSQTVSGSEVNSKNLNTRKKRQIQAKRSASQGLPLNTAKIEMEIDPIDVWGGQKKQYGRVDSAKTQPNSQGHNIPLGRRVSSQHNSNNNSYGSQQLQDQLVSNVDQENLIGAGRKVEHQKIKNRARDIQQQNKQQQEQQYRQDNHFDDLDSEVELEGELLCLQSDESQQKLAKKVQQLQGRKKSSGVDELGDRVSKRALEELKKQQTKSQEKVDKYNTIQDYLSSYEEETLERIATKFSGQENKSTRSLSQNNSTNLSQERLKNQQSGRRNSNGSNAGRMIQFLDQQQDKQDFLHVTGSDIQLDIDIGQNNGHQPKQIQNQNDSDHNQYNEMVRKGSSNYSHPSSKQVQQRYSDLDQNQPLQRQNTDIMLGNQAKRKMLTTNNQNKIQLAQQQGGHGRVSPFQSEVDYRIQHGLSMSSQQQEHDQSNGASQKVDNVDNSQSVPLTVGSTPLNSGGYGQLGAAQQKRGTDYVNRSPSDSVIMSPSKQVQAQLAEHNQKVVEKFQNLDGGMRGFPVNPVYEFDFAQNIKDYVTLPEQQKEQKGGGIGRNISDLKSDQVDNSDFHTGYSEADSSGLKNQIRQRSYIYEKQRNLTQIEENSHSSVPSGVNNLKNQFDFLNTDDTENTINLDNTKSNPNSAENTKSIQLDVQKQTPQVIYYNQQSQPSPPNQAGMSQDIKNAFTQDTDLSKQVQSIGRPGPSNHSRLEKVVTFDKLMEGYETNQQVQSLNDSFNQDKFGSKDQLPNQDSNQHQQDQLVMQDRQTADQETALVESKKSFNQLTDSKKSFSKLDDSEKKGGLQRKGSGDSNASVDLNDIYLVLRKFKKELVNKKGEGEEDEKDPDRSGRELDRIKRLINDIEGKANKLDTQQVIVKEKKKKKKDKERREKEKQKKEKERAKKKKNNKESNENEDKELAVKVRPVDESILDDHDYQDMQRQRKSIKGDLMQLQGYMDIALKNSKSPDISNRSHGRSFRSYQSGLSNHSNPHDLESAIRQASIKQSLAQQIHNLSSSIDNVTKSNVAATHLESIQRQEHYRYQYMREQQIREQQMREQQYRAQQIREQQIREQQIREQQIREQQIREQQIRDQVIRERQIREQQMREQQMRDQQLRELQIREREMDLTLRELHQEGLQPPSFPGQGLRGPGYQPPPLPQSTPYLQQVQNLPPQMQGLYNPQQSFVGMSQANPQQSFVGGMNQMNNQNQSFIGGMSQGPRSFIGGNNQRPGPSMGPMQGSMQGPIGGGIRPGMMPGMGQSMGQGMGPNMGGQQPPMQFSGMQMRPGMMQPGQQPQGFYNY